MPDTYFHCPIVFHRTSYMSNDEKFEFAAVMKLRKKKKKKNYLMRFV
jgi:hypothetical protein